MTTPHRLALLLLVLTPTAQAEDKPKPYRLKPVDIKQPVLWSTTLKLGEQRTLTVGGLDQSAPDGVAHYRLDINGQPDVAEMSRDDKRTLNLVRQLAAPRDTLRATLAQARANYLDDLAGGPNAGAFALVPRQQIAIARKDLAAKFAAVREYDLLTSPPTTVIVVANDIDGALARLQADLSADSIVAANRALVALEQVIDQYAIEPPPRALTAMTVIPSNHMKVLLFGGDHLDYLANDTWLFDADDRRWHLAHPKLSPPPRAGHTLRTNPDGTVTLTGGYTYANSTEYTGGQYVDLNDGEWTFRDAEWKNTAANAVPSDPRTFGDPAWSNRAAKGVPDDSRTYRTGPFHPDYFLKGDRPDAAKFQAFLKSLPPNTWTKTHPPRLPQLNRDWGTAVYDPNRGLILRWAGGHSAHGGTDVLHYHTATNRWELTAPVEFPLGQLYTNTEYPRGVSFNGRPWITGHTYQSYAVDPVSRRMLSVGQKQDTFLYDPDLGDWLRDRAAKPAGMSYGDCFYTLTCCPTPAGVYCWNDRGQLFLFDAAVKNWSEVKPAGQKLAGSSVDNSTLVFDARRNRLLFFRKSYGDKERFAGTFQSLDLESNEVTTVTPPNADHAAAITYLCQLRLDAANDLLLVGCTIPGPDPSAPRRTPAYDLRNDRWVSVQLAGDDPSGKSGRNVSLGLMYDDPRKLFWAVDAKSEVYVLRLDPKTVEMNPL